MRRRSPHAESDEESVFLKRCRRYAFVERLKDEGPEPTLPSYQLDPENSRHEVVERAELVIPSVVAERKVEFWDSGEGLR